MARESIFKKGMKVKCVLNEHSAFEIINVMRNELVIKPVGSKTDEFFVCKKKLFQKVELQEIDENEIKKEEI